MEEKTKVVFRVFNSNEFGESIYRKIIVLFPHIDEGNGFCGSYMNIGQHSSADYKHIISKSRPALPAEYSTLKKHLEADYGYKFLVIKKRTVNKSIKRFQEL